MKNFGIKLLKIIICLVPVYCYAQDTTSKKLSLSTCIQIALKNNLDVQKSGIQSENAQISLLQSRENILPVVNANIQHGVNEGRSINPYTNSYINEHNIQEPRISAALYYYSMALLCKA